MKSNPNTMKLDITEVYLVKQSVENQTIKATDAKAVMGLIEKLDKEFVRLQKLEEKKEAAPAVAVAK